MEDIAQVAQRLAVPVHDQTVGPVGFGLDGCRVIVVRGESRLRKIRGLTLTTLTFVLGSAAASALTMITATITFITEPIITFVFIGATLASAKITGTATIVAMLNGGRCAVVGVVATAAAARAGMVLIFTAVDTISVSHKNSHCRSAWPL
jgi:uracil phosphoribosyltransferase